MSNESLDPLIQKMATVMTIIDVAISKASTDNDRLMLACGMLQRTVELLDDLVGKDARKKMFKEHTQ